eukprot:12201385-Alexandrium_andersonii.AAC.1
MCIRDREIPIPQVQALRAAPPAPGSAARGVSDCRQCGAVETAVWPVGGAGTAAPSGCILGPELTLSRHQSDCLGVRPAIN